MTKPTRWELLELLPIGHENAKPAFLLAHQLGTTPRQVGQMVAEMRKAGILIGSGCGAEPGYFYCGSEEDVRIGLAHIVSRVSESMKAVRAVQAAALTRFGPVTASLFDLEAS